MTHHTVRLTYSVVLMHQKQDECGSERVAWESRVHTDLDTSWDWEQEWRRRGDRRATSQPHHLA